MVFMHNAPALTKGSSEPALGKGRARLYSNRFCPFAERALLYVAVKGIDVEIVNIDLKNKPECVEIVNIDLKNKPEWYFSKNPAGKVPTFEKDGKIVFESGIVPEYLDAVYPSTTILPEDPYLRASQKIILERASPITSTFFGLFSVYKDNLEGEARVTKVKPVEDALDTVEKLLKDKYFGGASPGYADWMLLLFLERIFLVSSMISLPDGFPCDRWPLLSAWWARMIDQSAARAVMQPTAIHIEFIKSWLVGEPNNDIGL